MSCADMTAPDGPAVTCLSGLLNPALSLMELLSDPNIWIAFAMLTALEIVLGIDNIIFISILVGRLPPHMRDKARRLGLGFAMISRLLLLFTLTWVIGPYCRHLQRAR